MDMPLFPALRRQRQVDLFEFEASLVYRASSRTARTTQRHPVSKNKQKRKRKKERKILHNIREDNISHYKLTTNMLVILSLASFI